MAADIRLALQRVDDLPGACHFIVLIPGIEHRNAEGHTSSLRKRRFDVRHQRRSDLLKSRYFVGERRGNGPSRRRILRLVAGDVVHHIRPGCFQAAAVCLEAGHRDGHPCAFSVRIPIVLLAIPVKELSGEIDHLLAGAPEVLRHRARCMRHTGSPLPLISDGLHLRNHVDGRRQRYNKPRRTHQRNRRRADAIETDSEAELWARGTLCQSLRRGWDAAHHGLQFRTSNIEISGKRLRGRRRRP